MCPHIVTRLVENGRRLQLLKLEIIKKKNEIKANNIKKGNLICIAYTVWFLSDNQTQFARVQSDDPAWQQR